jgi:peptidoglycan-associated lipoprotein
MKHQFRKSLIICLATTLCCAGCAKHEFVKQEPLIPAAAPAVAPATTSLPTQAVVPEEPKSAAKSNGLSGSAVNGSQAGDQASKAAATDAGKDGALQTALDRIFFDFDSHNLSPAARATLAKNAEILKNKGSVKVRIEGNCDELGSDDYNLSLGESRARAAMNYLQSLGVQSERLSVISYGKEKPAAAGHDEESRAKNRRDEFVLTSR